VNSGGCGAVCNCSCLRVPCVKELRGRGRSYGKLRLPGRPKRRRPGNAGPSCAASPQGGNYQMTTCLSPVRTIGEPALHWNAAAKVGRFDGAPMARNCAGACGSVARRTLAFSAVYLVRHTVAQLKKKRWSRVKPSTFGSSLPAEAFCRASYAVARPPRSAMFSPRVSEPLTCWSPTLYSLNWLTSLPVRPEKPFESASVHQFSKLPVGPKRLP